MNRCATWCHLAVFAALLLSASGCSFGTPQNPAPELSTQPKGPHGGEMLDLGGEELFGEFVHDNGKLTIYLFDDSKTAPAWGDQDELKLIVPMGLDRRTFILKPPQKEVVNEKTGKKEIKSIRTEFTSTDSELVGAFSQSDLSGVTFVGNVLGKQYEMDFDHKHHGATAPKSAGASK